MFRRGHWPGRFRPGRVGRHGGAVLSGRGWERSPRAAAWGVEEGNGAGFPLQRRTPDRMKISNENVGGHRRPVSGEGWAMGRVRRHLIVQSAKGRQAVRGELLLRDE